MGQIFSSTNPILQAYDIHAVSPNDFKTFKTACSLDVDIIVIPPSSYTSYIRHATIKSALDRGVHFEISLAPYLRNPDLRSNFFASGTALAAATGGKSILITNGAEKGMEVRGAYDLSNLATLLGIDFGIAKASLSFAPYSILQRSEARKAAKGVLRVTDIPGSPPPSKKGNFDPVTGPLPDFIPFSEDEPQKPEQKPEQKSAERGKRKGKRKAGE